MRVLMLTAHPGITGPLPKLAPLMIDEMRRLGCEVSTAPWSHRREDESYVEKAFGRARDLWHVRRLLKRGRFDVMLVTTTHNWPALLRDLPLIAFTRGLCRARVVQFHGSQVDKLVRPGHELLRLCSRWLTRRCDAVLVLSREERREWEAVCPAARFEVVVNPFVPLDVALGQPPHARGEPPVLLFVGRLVAEKGIFDLLGALRVVSEDRACVLLVAGEGSQEEAFRRRADDLGLGDRVRLVGYVEGEALARLYSSSDVFVLPTHSEGFPTVITEAMSFGLPIVTTPIRGALDHLSADENVLFVPPRRPLELARVLIRLLNDPDLCADMGERNREKVRDFAPHVVVQRYVDIMKSLITTGAEEHADTL